MKKNTADRDNVLDALRGIAAVMVVMFHLTIASGEPDYGLHLGVTGVDLFFIISGFVIFMSLNKTKSSQAFVTNRFIRLYPTYWACVTFTFLLNCVYALGHNGIELSYFYSYLCNMTMFQHYMGVANLDGTYWTLIVEMAFYLTMLVIYHFGQLKHVEIIGCIITGVALVATTLLKNISPVTYKKIDFLYPLLNHFPLFFAGILFYLIKNDRSTLIRWIICVLCFIISFVSYK